MAPVDDVTAQSREHCTIGRDQGCIRSQTEVRQQGCGVGRPATGSDGHRDSRVLRALERPRIALTDGLRQRRQKGAVHVDRDEPQGRGHTFSVVGN